MALYKLTKYGTVLRESDGAMIPQDASNRDFQDYRVWLDEGNAPDPVPEVSPPTMITTTAFWSRFSSDEQTAVQQAAVKDAKLMAEMIFALLRGQVDLGSVKILHWMDDLVAVQALTSERSQSILSP